MKTLGEFYREKVLSQKQLSRRTLPENSGHATVEKELFGWKLKVGRASVACRSRAEARYLKIFCDAGMDKVKVPKDDTYLEGILPELERLKAKIDEIVDSYLESILDRRTRETVRHRVFAEITK